MVKPISNADTGNYQCQTVRQKTINDGKKGFIAGAVVGAVEGFTRKSWLDNDKPSDKFIRNMSNRLTNALDQTEQVELNKVKTFFSSLLNAEVTPESLRAQIENSTELSKAVKKEGTETTKDALDRIFSNPDHKAMRDELRDLQNNTSVDKKVSIYTARDIIKKNYDAATKQLVKSEDTPQETFKMIKKAAKSIKIKTAVAHTIIGGVLAGTVGLLYGASKTTSKKD